MRSSRGLLAASLLALAAIVAPSAAAQQGSHSIVDASARNEPPAATFRSTVNLVSVSAVVRDRRGRVMSSLTSKDFEIIDGGRRRPVIDFQSDTTAPASVALLIDGSGSMALGAATDFSRRISADVLASLDPRRDNAALLSFDTRLLTLCEFTRDFDRIRKGLVKVDAFGSTSLYDAIAGSAAHVANRTQNRRAVIVLTDGADNASAYTPEQVSWIASTIDVPVYVFAVGDGAALPVNREGKAQPSPLAELAIATGGDLFIANTPELIAAAVKRVAEELRHQYVIAFEASAEGGLRRVEIRTRKSDLNVRSRNWYLSDSE
jgi:Ca-activated chloride channel family protein